MIPILEKTAVVLFLLVSSSAHAADSYRFFHVTIDTPWLIFIFLLMIILFPFVLSAILYWHFTLKKRKERLQQAGNAEAASQENGTSISDSAAPEEK